MFRRGRRFAVVGRIALLIVLPAILGLLLALAFQLFSLPNPLLHWRLTLDLGTLIFIIGLVISSVGALAVTTKRYWSSRVSKSVEAERARQLQARDQFLERLDHELKNPLAILQMSLANLEASQENDRQVQIAQEQLALLNHLGRSLRRLSSLVDYPLELSTLALPELLSQVIADIQEGAGAKRPDVHLEVQQVPWSPQPIVGDRDLLYLAFRNLTENAVKFTPPGDQVTVRVSESKQQLLVEIADRGQGIADRDLPYLFVPLFRGANARGVPGSGLGLAIAKAALDRHQGQIEVQSGLGEGTIFTVRLPLR